MDDGGECFVGGLGAGPEATRVCELPVVALGAGVRLFWVVFDRPRDSDDFDDFCGVRWEVERSKPGSWAAGGVGAGRKDVGPGVNGVIGGFETGGATFVGGGGAARLSGSKVENYGLRISDVLTGFCSKPVLSSCAVSNAPILSHTSPCPS